MQSNSNKGADLMKKKTATTKPKARTSVKVKDLSPKKNPKGGRVKYSDIVLKAR
jgi:hypothetical protein